MNEEDDRLGWWTAAVVAIGCVWAAAVRPPFPVDETRYLAVAWEMAWRGVWGVPLLEGEPYVQKPPLLFWLWRLGWMVGGVSEWWPRVVAGGFALATLGVVASLARTLGVRAGLAVAAVASGAAWAGWSTTLYFDGPLVFFTTLAVLGVVRLAAGEREGGWWLAVGVGLGGLMKGPLVAVPLVGLVGLLRWWAPGRGWRTVATVVGWGAAGSVLPLTWLGWVAWSEGREVAWAVVVAQGLGRLGEEADHAAPWWWYVPVAAAVVWPAGWVGIRALRELFRREGVGKSGEGIAVGRWLVAGTLPALVLLSWVSGKRAQYLLPLWPLVAVGIAAGWERVRAAERVRRWEAAAIAAPLGVGGAILMGTAAAAELGEEVAWWSPRWGVVGAGLVGLGVTGFWGWHRWGRMEVGVGVSWATVGWLSWGAVWASMGAFDARVLGNQVAAWQAEGRAVAWVGGRHHGAWNFAGRLREPLYRLETHEVPAWQSRFREGVVLRLVKRRSEISGECVRWRSDWVCWGKGKGDRDGNGTETVGTDRYRGGNER
ncbi:MAG: glycosyltransferase family 39 protein [Hydrogenophilus sp.]|nr:glycosyltransferase family 39 protein [Hydrogenophilus sp.]